MGVSYRIGIQKSNLSSIQNFDVWTIAISNCFEWNNGNVPNSKLTSQNRISIPLIASEFESKGEINLI